MKFNRLGQTDLHVSPVGWGTVKLGRDQQVKYPADFVLPDDDQAAGLLALALDLGINLIDTAPAYGTSEERLGKLLHKQRRHWVVSTKVGEEFSNGESLFDFTPAHLRFSIERSLRRLCTDYLDVVLVHSNGNDREIIERYEVFAELEELKRAGWIRAFGMSTKTIEGGLITAQYADVAMVTYNPQHLDELAVIDECQRRHKGVLIKKALSSGHLASNPIRSPAANSTDPEQDPVQESLNLVFGHSGVTSAILGTINPRHLRENAQKAQLALNPK